LWLTALVPVGYRMAEILTERRIAWIVAVLIIFSYYLQELTAGAEGTDHNDAVFIAVIACSLWALLELWKDGRLRWALLAGLFSGCAILTKWYVGLCVFLPWGIMVAVNGFRRKESLDLVIGSGVAAVIAISWIVSITWRFPEAAAYEWSFKSGHLSQAIDGHTGTWAYHFNVIQYLLPPFTWWLVLPA
jgi:4-amino-4-deoxy-L-arabinose transferase-like glycosyltransferase